MIDPVRGRGLRRKARGGGAVLRGLTISVAAVMAVGSLGSLRAEADVSYHTLSTWTPSVAPPGVTSGVLAGSTTLFVDSVDRVMYAVSRNFSAGWLSAYDADTLHGRGAGISTDLLTSALADVQGGRLLTASLSANGAPVLEVFKSGATGVTRPSVATLTGAGSATLNGLAIVGMTQPDENDLYVLAAQYDTVFVPNTMALAKIDLSSLTSTSVSVTWAVPLPSCQIPIAVTNQQGMAISSAGLTFSVPNPAVDYVPATTSKPASIYVGCDAPSATVLADRTALPAGVGKLILPAGAAPTAANFGLFSHPGDYSHGDSVMDPVTHRLIITTGQTAVVFDTASDAFVGSINLGLQPSMLGVGLNPATGQLYGLANHHLNGLVSAFIRLTPAGQAYFDPAYYPQKSPNPSPIAVDPTTNRLFLLNSTGDSNNDAYFVVVHYDGTAADQPLPPDVDLNTANLEEQAGQTAHTYSGSTEGYGAILRWVGGRDATVENAAFFNPEGVGAPSPGTRELRLAYLDHLSLSLSQASAASIPVDRDVINTGHDQAQVCGLPSTQTGAPTPTPSPPPSPLPNSTFPPSQWNDTVCAWPYPAASCNSYGGPADQHQASNSLGNAAANCDVDHQLVSTSAYENGVPTSAVEVTSGSVQSSVTVNTTDGTVSTVTSTAKGIDLLGGAVQIGKVTTTAISKAHGRPGTALSTFTTQVQNVVIQGTDVCSTQCDMQTLAAQINSEFSGQMRVSFPTPDASVAASPGGYQALNRQSLADQVQESDLNDQPGDRTEVPGMIVTVFMGDNTQPERLMAYLGGAETEARYGIYSLDQVIDQPVPGTPFQTGLPPDNSVNTITQTLGGDQAGGAGGPGGSTGGGGGNTRQVLAGLLPPGGWHWIAEHPIEALKLLFMWAVLLSPIYVASRRWLLLQRNRVLLEAIG